MPESSPDPSRELWDSHPRLLPGSTVIAEDSVVHLIAGEDFRFTIQTGDATPAIARVLRGCQGDRPLADLLAGLDPAQRDLAPSDCRPSAVRTDALRRPAPPSTRDSLANRNRGGQHPRPAGPGVVAVHRWSALSVSGGKHNAEQPQPRRCLARSRAGPAGSRPRPGAGIQSPAIGGRGRGLALGHHGPPLARVCQPGHPQTGPPLSRVRHFRRLSPAPQLYDVLERPAEPIRFVPGEPAEPLARIVLEIANWKLRRLGQSPAAASQFALHVVEGETLETTLHPVWLDPTCPGCGDG